MAWSKFYHDDDDWIHGGQGKIKKGGNMLDPSMLDPTVFKAAQQAGLDHVEDMNHNGKLDVQDVALMKATVPMQPAQPQISEPIK